VKRAVSVIVGAAAGFGAAMLAENLAVNPSAGSPPLLKARPSGGPGQPMLKIFNTG